jgi:hypothetical protein
LVVPKARVGRIDARKRKERRLAGPHNSSGKPFVRANDCVFAVAGALDSALGSPDIDHQAGLTVPPRSLYFRHAAEKQMEFLRIFDAAGATECYRRKESILPQQALALANSELSLKMARRLAPTLSDRLGPDPSGFITAAFERVLSRPPTDAERAECLRYLGRDAGMRRRESLVHVLLNHHDFVTIRSDLARRREGRKERPRRRVVSAGRPQWSYSGDRAARESCQQASFFEAGKPWRGGPDRE